MYLLKLISLINCPYSNAAKEFLDKKNIKYKLINVDQKTKEKYKNKNINTFPQIYLYKNNKEILLGGYDDIIEVHRNIYKIELNKSIKYLNQKFPNMSRKHILRIIETLNN
tara:strand:- start:8 stop:340 length:333 start_codon:yes stop_codon:yes gene_type:complete